MDDRTGGAVEYLGDNNATQFSQERSDMLERGQNPEGSVSPLNFEIMADELGDSGSQSRVGKVSNLSPQLQELVATVMAAITSETAKLASNIQTLKSEIKAEIKQVARDLTAKFEASQNQFREDMRAELNSEILGVSAKINEVARNTESQITKVSSRVEIVQTTINTKVETRAADVKKYVDDKIKEVREDRQLAHRNSEEILKVKDKIRELENKLTLGGHPGNQVESVSARGLTQPDQNAGAAGSSTNSNLVASGSCDGESQGTSADGSVINQPINSGGCTIVNASSEALIRGVDLQELTLPIFSDSSKQVPLHFIRDLELYFKLKQTPDNLKLPLAFRAVQEPIAKQWFSSAYDKLGGYLEFKKGFTDLLWNPSRQAGIRSKIYLDRHRPESKESFVDHYIRYANLASTLDPPLQDTDLLSALTAHYEPRVQQGLLCGNFKCTQEVLGYLSKIQSLQEDRAHITVSDRSGNSGEGSRRHNAGLRRDDRPNRTQQFNVRAIHRQTTHPNSRHNDRRNYNGRSGEFHGRGGENILDYTNNRLHPNSRPFSPQVTTTELSPGGDRPRPLNEGQELNQ